MPYRPSLETLEPRRVLAGLWQASPNPLDVDASGFVEPLDVLLVVNDINQNGTRELPATKPQDFSGPLCDVNGDGLLGALDVLLIVNAINHNPHAPSLSLALSAESDPNGDYVLLAPTAIYQGLTKPNAPLLVEVLDGEQVLDSFTVHSDGSGAFEIEMEHASGVNHVRFTVTDARGRSVHTERLTRVGDVLTAWNATMLEVVRESTNVLSSGALVKPPPPMVAKFLAMMHGAMFDAINAVEGGFESYAFDQPAEGDISSIAAASSAAHRIATSLFPSQHDRELWDATLAEVSSTIADGPAKEAGVQLGILVAKAMLAQRESDGAAAESDYSSQTSAGKWRPSAPEFADPTLPQWGEVAPFAMESGGQFRPTAPPNLGSAEYAAALDEVLRLGSASGSERTADQTEIAHFWADGGGTSTPPGHWNQIAIDLALAEQLPLLEAARMMAWLNYALADAGIASWDAKYAFDLWRPIDAIRQAGADGNPLTSADSAWTPLLVTPSFPTYTSGHSTFSGAAAAVLTEIFGDDYAFTTRADRGSTGAWPPSDDVTGLAVRDFSSFWEAAEEAGQSRIYGGIHFRFDNTAGLDAGEQVGKWVVARLLQPDT